MAETTTVQVTPQTTLNQAPISVELPSQTFVLQSPTPPPIPVVIQKPAEEEKAMVSGATVMFLLAGFFLARLLK